MASAATASQQSSLSGSPTATHALKLAVVAALAGYLYTDVVRALFHDWWTDASHGILIPPLVAYIVWIRHKALAKTPVRPVRGGIILTALACIALLGGELASEFFISRVSLVILIAGLVLTFWGMARLRMLALPLLLLLTMIPMPLLVYNSVSVPLQLLASATAEQAARMLGVVVYREGNIIHLADTSLGVAEACSGLRSLASLVIMSLLIAFVQCRRIRTRITLVSAAVPIAIVVNVFRVCGTAVLGDYNPALAMGFYHSFSGWVVFVAAMVLMFGTATIVRKVFE